MACTRPRPMWTRSPWCCKIRSRRVTGLTMQEQREVATAIKNAREMALLPYPAAAKR